MLVNLRLSLKKKFNRVSNHQAIFSVYFTSVWEQERFEVRFDLSKSRRCVYNSAFWNVRRCFAVCFSVGAECMTTTEGHGGGGVNPV
jgi:hypothetical protein